MLEFLRILEGIRTGVGDAFFSLITRLGEETLFLVVGLLFFWCVNKRQGYFLLFVGFLGTVFNQFLKLFFRIPRPWVRDPALSVVGNAKEAATGYSFPSGHTQTAVGLYGGIARFATRWWVRTGMIVLCLLVGFSRMYLGVHTPLDVGVSFAVASLLVLVLYPLIGYATQRPQRMRVLFAAAGVTAAALLLFVLYFPFPRDIDPHNYESGLKNACKILGCLIGLWLAYEVDERYLHFDTKAVWWAQILKLVLGFVLLLGIRYGAKPLLNVLCGNRFWADGLRYGLIAVFGGCVWPMTFRFFARLGQKQ